jgi:hypothetical protein
LGNGWRWRKILRCSKEKKKEKSMPTSGMGMYVILILQLLFVTLLVLSGA